MKTWRSAPLLLAALVTMPACTEPEGAARRAEEAASAPPDALAALEATPETARDEASACPEGASPARLEVAAIDTVMTWCVRSEADGTRVQHGPWRKERAGRLIESGSYQEGLRHGDWTLHWGSGEVQSSGAYVKGRKAGPWTFFSENGAMIRRVDYDLVPAQQAEAQEPDAEEPGAETAEADEEAPKLARVSLSLANAHATDIVFALEPWAEEYEMPPGSTFEISAQGTDAGDLVVESSENSITVWAREGSDVQLWYDGVEVIP